MCYIFLVEKKTKKEAIYYLFQNLQKQDFFGIKIQCLGFNSLSPTYYYLPYLFWQKVMVNN